MSQSKEIRRYHYFDTPDGHDVFKKLWCVMRPASLIAFGLGTFDVFAYSHPKGYLQTLGRYAYIGFPVIGTSAAFVFATNAVGSFRNKDDRWNWFIGGFSAGSVLGVWRRSPLVGFNCGMLLGILGLCRKAVAENGWNFTPPDKVPISYRNAWSYDFTLMKDRPGNWTTGKD